MADQPVEVTFEGDLAEAVAIIVELKAWYEMLKKDRDTLAGILVETMVALQLPIPETPDNMLPMGAKATFKELEDYRKISLAARRFVDSLPDDTSAYPWSEFMPDQMKAAEKLFEIVRSTMTYPLSDYLRPGEENE